MPRFTRPSKQEQRAKRDKRRARSTPTLPPTLPPAPRLPRRGVTFTPHTRSGRKVVPGAKTIEDMSAQALTQPTQPTREVTACVSHLEFHDDEWGSTQYEQVPEYDTCRAARLLFENLLETTH